MGGVVVVGGCGFGRCQRIRRSLEFVALRDAGQREFARTMIMNWRLVSGRSYSRLGVVVSRRVDRSAVGRARVRRLFREVFRRNQWRLVGSFDLVLVARQLVVGVSLWRVERDLLGLWRRIEAIEGWV